MTHTNSPHEPGTTNALILIERLQRDGASPREIDRTVRETAQTDSPRGARRRRGGRRLLRRLR